MTDRLTQLQDRVDSLAEQFYVYLGVLQRDAPPSSLQPSTTSSSTENHHQHAHSSNDISSASSSSSSSSSSSTSAAGALKAQSVEMARALVLNTKAIDELIESLPGINNTKPQQVSQLRHLEEENQRLGLELKQNIVVAERALRLVREALNEIYEDRAASQEW
ncbi:Mediator of RNA polymerase II transcription subunit 21 [Balamuthia mandrillaris]